MPDLQQDSNLYEEHEDYEEKYIKVSKVAEFYGLNLTLFFFEKQKSVILTVKVHTFEKATKIWQNLFFIYLQ